VSVRKSKLKGHASAPDRIRTCAHGSGGPLRSGRFLRLTCGFIVASTLPGHFVPQLCRIREGGDRPCRQPADPPVSQRLDRGEPSGRETAVGLGLHPALHRLIGELPTSRGRRWRTLQARRTNRPAASSFAAAAALRHVRSGTRIA
jgi:hypothetical protein